MNNAVSGKVMEHVRKHRETTEEWRSLEFGNKTKVSYNKIFFRKFISHIDEKNTTIHEYN